ncbi:hypothetical protein HG531_010340 [Fusarium graminearum]|nr:hypothetical protein HG531_010340 [Fusarium graminearum]
MPAARKDLHCQFNSSTDNDHETVAEKEESEHVVDPAEPDRVHNEEQLDEDGTKGKKTDDKHARYGLEEEVQEEEAGKDDTRDQDRGQGNVQLPGFTLPGLDKDHNNDGCVDEPEPVDLGIEYVQVFVPTSSPGSLGLAPEDTVAETDMLLLAIQNDGRVVTAISFAAVLLGTRLHNHTNHTALVGILVDLVILDDNFVVVVEEDVVVLVVLAKQEPRVVKGSSSQLIKNFLASWQSIHQPFQTVALFDATLDKVD